MAVGQNGLVEERPAQVEGEQAFAVILLHDNSRKRSGLAGGALVRAAEADGFADPQLFRRTDKSAPMRIVLALVQGRVDPRHRLSSAPRAKQLRRDDLGVIDHQHVAGAQEFWEIEDMGVARLLRRDHQ